MSYEGCRVESLVNVASESGVAAACSAVRQPASAAAWAVSRDDGVGCFAGVDDLAVLVAGRLPLAGFRVLCHLSQGLLTAFSQLLG